MRFSPLHRLFTTPIFAEKSTENQQSRENPPFHRFAPAAVKCKNIYVPIRPVSVPIVPKTKSIISLSHLYCFSTLCGLVFIFSMAQRNSAAQCQIGRNSTNQEKSEKNCLKMCNKITCDFSLLVTLPYSGRRRFAGAIFRGLLWVVLLVYSVPDLLKKSSKPFLGRNVGR